MAIKNVTKIKCNLVVGKLLLEIDSSEFLNLIADKKISLSGVRDKTPRRLQLKFHLATIASNVIDK